MGAIGGGSSGEKKFSKGIGIDTGDNALDVLSDRYMMKPDKYQTLEDMGMDVEPVDANGGFVPLDRDDPDNLGDAQDNLQRRFNMGQTPWGVDPYIDQKANGGKFSPIGNAFNNKIRR